MTTTEAMIEAGLSARYEYRYDGDRLERRRRLRIWHRAALVILGLIVGDAYAEEPDWEPVHLSETERKRVQDVSQ